MKWWSLLAASALLFAGCLSDDDAPDDPLDNAAEAEPEAPYRVDATFDLLPTGMDETWTWSMSPGMTGDVELTFIPDPASTKSSDQVCYRLTWPEGAHRGGTNCGDGNVGNVAVQISGNDLLMPETFYDVYLVPNTFTLRVWTPQGGDAAQVHVYVETFAAPEA